MANLIITIISLAIVGIAAAMAVFYGGTAFSGSQAQIYANTLISESQQLMLADTQYMLDKGKTSFSDFEPNDASLLAGGYTSGNAGVPILGFYSFTTDPNGNTSYQEVDEYLEGFGVKLRRTNINILGTNVILYNFYGAGFQDLSPASMANNILVQICKDINAQMPPPAGLTYSGSGLPIIASQAFYPGGVMTYYLDSPTTTLNYCYFGHDTSVGGAGYNMIFAFAN
jgi:hypothetical protein